MSREGGVRKLQKLRVAFIPEDRKEEGLFLCLTIAQNISIALYFAKSGLIKSSEYQDIVSNTIINKHKHQGCRLERRVVFHV